MLIETNARDLAEPDCDRILRPRGNIPAILTSLMIFVCYALSSRPLAARELRWVGANDYRLIVSLTPGRLPWKTTPVRVELSPAEIQEAVDLSATKMNLTSVRVAAYDAQGEVLVYNNKKKVRYFRILEHVHRFFKVLKGFLQQRPGTGNIYPHKHGATCPNHCALIQPEFCLLQHELVQVFVIHT